MVEGGKVQKIAWAPYAGAQTAFLASTADEVLYGGAVYGGKTDTLLAWPLHRAWHPLHRGIFFRRKRLRLQEAIDRARTLYKTVDPKGIWHETELRWKWSTGAYTQFAMAEEERDIEAWKSFEFDLVSFDELTEFTEWQYRFMFMRLRSKVPEFRPWMRCATNPGGDGMDWVDRRFIGVQHDGTELFKPYVVYEHTVEVDGMEPMKRTRQRIPSSVFDMPDTPQRQAYIASLADLPEEEREAYLYGRWGLWRGQFFSKLPTLVKPEPKTTDWFCIRAMDYGFEDPCCVLWLFVYPGLGLVEVVAEVYERRMTTDSIAQMIKAKEAEMQVTPRRLLASVMSPDAFRHGPDQGQSIASLLAEKGIFFQRANNDRVAGWAQVRRLIGRDTLRVWQGRAPNLVRTLPRLPRDPKKRDDIKQTGVEDHAAETLRYAVMAYVAGPENLTVVNAPPKPERKDPYWDKMHELIHRPPDPWSEFF